MEQQQQHNNGRRQVLYLPQWNSRFSFSAQKAQQDNKDQHRHATTPGGGLRGQARRVPVPAGAGGAGPGAARPQQPDATKGASKGTTTPLEAAKTPTLCLFERFERLTLGATPYTGPNTAAAAAAAAPTRAILSAAPASTSQGSAGSASSRGSEQFAGRARHGRRSVAFGTPSVLAYTPARPAGDDATAAGQAQDCTPLWSNAGHTPYSLAGSSGYSGGRIQELADNDEYQTAAAASEEEEEGSCNTAADQLPLIRAGAGVQRVGLPGAVRMELFTSIIHEVTQEDAQVTPASGTVALRLPETPLESGASPDAARERQADSMDVAAGLLGGAGAEGEDIDDDDDGVAGSECGDEGSECASDMELQTPATLPFSACLQRTAVASGGKSTASKALSKQTPAGASAGAGKGGSCLKAAAAAAAAAAQAAAAKADSPSGGSSFTGFAGRASAGQQAGSVTPTLFDGGRRGQGASRAATSSLEGLMAAAAGSSTATSRATPAAAIAARPAAAAGGASARRGGDAADAPRTTPAPAAAAAMGRAAAAAATHVARMQSSRGGATPTTAPRQRTLHFGGAGAVRTPVAAPAVASAAASKAAATPGTAPRQRTLQFGSPAGDQRTPAATACAAAAAGRVEEEEGGSGFCSLPEAGAVGGGGVGRMLPPAAVVMTPKSKLRQPERVTVEMRTPSRPTELSKLLGDADAAAAAAAVLGRCGGGGAQEAVLGSCEVLSPVRARRHAQQMLGAADQVLTPVRRSARKAKGVSAVVPHPAAAAVQPMLEATNYCYQPNDALQH